MPTATAQLYEQDFVRWAKSQAEALRDASRSGTNLPLDWDNLIEEVESLGRSERRELESRLATVLEHLLRLEYSSATNPRAGWRNAIRRERRQIKRVLAASLSLKAKVSDIIAEELRSTAGDVADTLKDHGETDQAVLTKLAGARYD